MSFFDRTKKAGVLASGAVGLEYRQPDPTYVKDGVTHFSGAGPAMDAANLDPAGAGAIRDVEAILGRRMVVGPVKDSFRTAKQTITNSEAMLIDKRLKEMGYFRYQYGLEITYTQANDYRGSVRVCEDEVKVSYMAEPLRKDY